MRNLMILAFAAATVASHAFVTATGPFPTSALLTSNFDSMVQGSYTSFPVFSGFGIAFGFNGGGSLVVGPPAPFQSAPNALFGQGTDVEIRMNLPMRRFGGWFHDMVLSNGQSATQVNFAFFNGSTPIGTASAPLTSTWTWIGFKTQPKWTRVQITGNIGGTLGWVVMDNLRVRPN